MNKSVIILLTLLLSLVISSCIFSPDSSDFKSDFPDATDIYALNDLGIVYRMRINSNSSIELHSYTEVDSTNLQLNGVDVAVTLLENTPHGYWHTVLRDEELSMIPNFQPNSEVQYSWVINGDEFTGTITLPLIDECEFNEPESKEDMFLEWEESEDPQLHTITVFNYYSKVGYWELKPQKRSFTIDKSYFPVESQKPAEPNMHLVFVSAIDYDLYDNCLIYARSTHSHGWDPE